MARPRIAPFSRRVVDDVIDGGACTARGGAWLKAEAGFGYACFMYQLVSKLCLKVRRDAATGAWALDDAHGGPGCGAVPGWRMEQYEDLPVATAAGAGACTAAVLAAAIPASPTIEITVRSGEDPLVEFYAAVGSGAPRISFGSPILWPFFLAIGAAALGVVAIALTVAAVLALLANWRATRFGEEHDEGSFGGDYVDTTGDPRGAFNRPFLFGGGGALTSRARGATRNSGREAGSIVWES
jgi:hypothetical protein